MWHCPNMPHRVNFLPASQTMCRYNVQMTEKTGKRTKNHMLLIYQRSFMIYANHPISEEGDDKKEIYLFGHQILRAGKDGGEINKAPVVPA